MIPCIKNKCLLYPACRNRTSIECQEIAIYYYQIRATSSRNQSWDAIKKHLKSMRTFKTEEFIYMADSIPQGEPIKGRVTNMSVDFHLINKK